MNFTAQDFFRAVWLSLIEPADMGRKAVSVRVERRDLWLALILIVVLNVLLRALTRWLLPEVAAFQDQFAVVSHFTTAVILAGFVVGLAYGLYYAGRVFGGQADLRAVLTLMVWFQTIMLTLEVVQLGVTLVSPAIGAIFGMLMLGGLLWCMLNFINVMHGFGSLGKSAVTFVLALVGSVILIPILLTMLGVGPVGGPV